MRPSEKGEIKTSKYAAADSDPDPAYDIQQAIHTTSVSTACVTYT
jgi:hypothetical protein